MDHLLLLRDRSNMEVCLLDFGKYSLDDVPYMNLWMQHALLCQTQMLSFSARGGCALTWRFPLDNFPVISQHLAKLELLGLRLQDNFTDFSSSPALKDLKLTRCFVDAQKIYSRSLRCLNCDGCSFSDIIRVRVFVPNLISLQLINVAGRTPLFEDMPELVGALVRFDSRCDDSCCGINPGYCNDDDCEECYGVDDSSAGCVLLKSFSAATNLKLTAEPKVFILKRDLRWCPIFSKLKTLLLTEWCLADDHRPLICILQHAPVLKKLTLELTKQQKSTNMVPSKAIYNSKEQPFASESLTKVEVKCCEVDQMVHQILKSLVNFGIPLEKISIEQKNKPSECFSFICTGFNSVKS